MLRRKLVAAVAVLSWAGALIASPQLTESIIEPQHPAIQYGTPANDPVAELNRALQTGAVRLEFDRRTGYLRSLLDALDIPVESQLALFSGTSLQARNINARNPRTIFFNDSVAVAWMSGGFIEVASHDAMQGAVFYVLPQTRAPMTQLVRDTRCLTCHYSTATLGVPGFLARSIPAASDGMILPWLGNYTTDHRSPIEERWGGWYVTGRGAGRHLGNAPITDKAVRDVRVEDSSLNLATLANRFDTDDYLSPHSDVVALLVFDHQMRMMNLLTRLGWEARVLAHEKRADVAASLRPLVVETVDYLLFVDEAAIEPVQGSSGFAERFSARGPRGPSGRSLRDLDLQRRLLRYPCSYMIYSEAFDALPPVAKTAVYQRLWEILSGREGGAKYARLSAEDRRAVVEILSETKPEVSAVFSLPQSRP